MLGGVSFGLIPLFGKKVLMVMFADYSVLTQIQLVAIARLAPIEC
jgi:hypothetical protein